MSDEKSLEQVLEDFNKLDLDEYYARDFPVVDMSSIEETWLTPEKIELLEGLGDGVKVRDTILRSTSYKKHLSNTSKVLSSGSEEVRQEVPFVFEDDSELLVTRSQTTNNIGFSLTKDMSEEEITNTLTSKLFSVREELGLTGKETRQERKDAFMELHNTMSRTQT